MAEKEMVKHNSDGECICQPKMITLCIADDCLMRGRHAEHITDYALRAAREWLVAYSYARAPAGTSFEYEVVEALATIIRKHVNDNMGTITEQYVLSEMGDKFVKRGTINDCATCKHNHLDHW